MKGFKMNSQTNSRSRGFTLIELLVVIAIIGILAGMLLTIGGKANQMMKIKRATAELQKVQSAINSYKAKLGHYPPDNINNVANSPLYYELLGCRQSAGGFVTLDSSSSVTLGQLGAVGASGIVNAASGQGDEGGAAQSFIKDIKPGQFGDLGGNVRVFGVKVDGPAMVGDINPFRYQSSNPANNVNTFDLWIDITVGKKTHRINNWRSTPIILP